MYIYSQWALDLKKQEQYENWCLGRAYYSFFYSLQLAFFLIQIDAKIMFKKVCI